MKKLNFAIELNITPVILVSTHQIIEISIKDELLGYVYIEESNTQADCIVPFTNEGEMPETDCINCSLKALFAARTFMNVDQIDIAEHASTTGLKDLLLGAVARAKVAAKKENN